MEFKKRLKTRFCVSVIIGMLGAVLMAIGFFNGDDSASSFGLMFVVIDVARIMQYKRITKTEESLYKREIAETDERNVMLWIKARSFAISEYIVLAATAVVVFSMLDMQVYADVISYSLFGFVVIYWICYLLLAESKKSPKSDMHPKSV